MKTISEAERQEAFSNTLALLASHFPKQVIGSHMHNLWDGCEVFLAHVLAFDNVVRKWNPVFGNSASTYINMICDCTWQVGAFGIDTSDIV